MPCLESENEKRKKIRCWDEIEVDEQGIVLIMKKGKRTDWMSLEVFSRMEREIEWVGDSNMQ